MQTLPDRFTSDSVAALCRRHGIVSLSLFGSFARGEQRPDSDIDLLVQFRAPKSLLTVIGIEREFSDLLGRPVELLTPQSVHPLIKGAIDSDLNVLYDEC